MRRLFILAVLGGMVSWLILALAQEKYDFGRDMQYYKSSPEKELERSIKKLLDNQKDILNNQKDILRQLDRIEREIKRK